MVGRHWRLIPLLCGRRVLVNVTAIDLRTSLVPELICHQLWHFVLVAFMSCMFGAACMFETFLENGRHCGAPAQMYSGRIRFGVQDQKTANHVAWFTKIGTAVLCLLGTSTSSLRGRQSGRKYRLIRFPVNQITRLPFMRH